MKMIRNVFGALALVALSAGAYAHGNGNGVGGGVVIGGAAAGYAGSVTGSAGSYSSGNAVAATQVNGYGSSFQHTDGFTGGTATVGGSVNHLGAQVVTGTTQVAQVNSYGSVSGNAPIEVAGGLIANGTGGLGKTDTYAGGTANFATGAIGGVIGIGGAAGIFGF